MLRASVRAVLVSLVGALAFPAAAPAGVKTEERTQVQFTGLLGGLMNAFGGKAVKEGVVNRVAVVGDRRLTLNDENGEIVDLGEEKIYELNVKDRTYRVTTFEELKKRFEEQRAKAEKEAEKARKEQEKEKKEGEAAPEFEVDVRVSRTGEMRTIAGHEAKQAIVRISVYPKGSSLQQSGGLGIVSDQWLAPDVPELRDIQEFDLRYAKRMAEHYGFDAGTMKASADQMAALVASYPNLASALQKLKEEGSKLEGTPLLSTLSINLVRSAEQVAQAEKQDSEITGVSGFLAKKLMKKASGDPTKPTQPILTTTVETLRIVPGATDADVALPAEYKQK